MTNPIRIGSLCSGYGGLTLAVQEVLGGEVAWHSEYDDAPSKVLDLRFPGVPNLGDMTAIDWETAEPVDVYEGGTPCQDVSLAGGKAGMREGTRSGLWASFAQGISVLRPQLVFWENVRGVASANADSDVEPCPGCVGDRAGGSPLRALGRVLGDLADLGYDARWVGLPASAVGAPHERFRYFVAAYPQDLGHERPWEAWGRRAGSADSDQPVADADCSSVREQSVTIAGSSGQAVAGHARSDSPADADGHGLAQLGGVVNQQRDPDGCRSTHTAWGAYEPAIRRWERVTGRPAPLPRRLSDRGATKLTPEFDEWLMGLPAGWVSDVPGISWNDKLKLCGNGVVPQQAAAALRHLLDLP